MDLYERYQQGHYGDTMGPSLAAPLWARTLGWDGLGCWVVVKQSDLLAAVPGLVIHGIASKPAVMIVKHPPSDVLSIQNFFEDLEEHNFNVIAHARSLHLVCLGATLVRTMTGLTELVGVFELQAQNAPDLPILHLRVSHRLILCVGVGSAELPTGIVDIPYFKVPAKVTMNSSMVSDLAEETVEDIKMPVRRKGSLGHVFLRQNTKGVEIGQNPLKTPERKTLINRVFTKNSY